MDGRTFDDLVRSFASRSSRRRLLRRGVAAAAAAAGLATLDPAGAARRGYSARTNICTPVAGGGYASMTVSTALLPGYLAAGAVLDQGCCAASDCGGGDGCAAAVCTVATGACELVFESDGTECTPNGPVNHCRLPYTCQGGVCSEGVGIFCPSIVGGCFHSIGCNPATGLCETAVDDDGTACFRTGCADGFCQAGTCMDPPVKECSGDACNLCGYDACNDVCSCIAVGCARDPDCELGHCDPAVGCVFESINEGGTCTSVPGGVCVDGDCTAAVQEE
jgi:hypothetical protein